MRVDDREKFLLPRVIGLQDGGSGAVVILHDVTRFRLLDDVKTNLVATVSHELKTPLTSIRMAVYLLLEERIGALNPKQTELLIASRDDAERLLDLINNLLDLARLESGAAVSERRAQPPEELVRQRGERSAGNSPLPAAGATITTQVAIPACRPWWCPPTSCGHVFSNLDFQRGQTLAAGGRNHRRWLHGRRRTSGRSVRFSVTWIAGPAFRRPSGKGCSRSFTACRGNRREGAGLGLAICREIVHAHDGQIGVVPAQGGRGSEFFFTLPVAGAATDPVHP